LFPYIPPPDFPSLQVETRRCCLSHCSGGGQVSLLFIVFFPFTFLPLFGLSHPHLFFFFFFLKGFSVVFSHVGELFSLC